MKFSEGLLVAENPLEHALLRKFVERALFANLDPKKFGVQVEVGDPDESGVMAVQAAGEVGWVEFDARIEGRLYTGGPCPERPEGGQFGLLFRWSQGETEGFFDELDERCVCEEPWDDVPPEATPEGPGAAAPQAGE